MCFILNNIYTKFTETIFSYNRGTLISSIISISSLCALILSLVRIDLSNFLMDILNMVEVEIRVLMKSKKEVFLHLDFQSDDFFLWICFL